jgi:crossover junction endodeoxyribonuclease RuvC
MILIGCDPGVTGALARFLGANLLGIKDIPSDEIVTEAKGAHIRDLIGGPKAHKKHRINAHGLAAVLRDWSEGHSVRLIREAVHPRGGQGAVSSGALMEVVGLIDGTCAALGIEVVKVDPSVWKLAMGINDNKTMSCRRAIKEFPMWASMFKRVSVDHDRAEAALLGLYGVRHLPRE